MLTLRPAEARGTANIGWLQSWHTFSFGNYYHPEHMGFASLRVINEDKIAPGQGFATHGHRDMEIVTYVLSGELEHRDSLGNGSVIRPGDVQRMSAGTGILHSEFNASQTDPVHLLQIWLLPTQAGIEPSYEQIHIPAHEKQGQLRLIGSVDGREGSITIHQDVNLYAARLQPDESLAIQVARDRQLWLQMTQGHAVVNHQPLKAGDGVALTQVETLQCIGGHSDAEFLLFDMA